MTFSPLQGLIRKSISDFPLYRLRVWILGFAKDDGWCGAGYQRLDRCHTLDVVFVSPSKLCLSMRIASVVLASLNIEKGLAMSNKHNILLSELTDYFDGDVRLAEQMMTLLKDMPHSMTSYADLLAWGLFIQPSVQPQSLISMLDDHGCIIGQIRFDDICDDIEHPTAVLLHYLNDPDLDTSRIKGVTFIFSGFGDVTFDCESRSAAFDQARSELSEAGVMLHDCLLTDDENLLSIAMKSRLPQNYFKASARKCKQLPFAEGF